MADKFSSAKVVGIDFCAIQPTWLPPNCRFQIDDAQLEWQRNQEYLDFVHIRALYGCIDDWLGLYRQAYKGLVPGGWIEHLEFDITPYSQAPEVADDEDHIFKQWSNVLLEAMERTGKTGRIGMDGTMRKHMEEASFVDIVEETYRVPCGSWTKDPRMKQIGRYNAYFLDVSLEGLALLLLKEVMGWEYTDITTFVAKMRSALKDTKNLPYYLV